MTDRLDRCFVCGSYRNIELHHIYYGGLRSVSDAHGFTVPLCHFCHNEPPAGVHINAEIDTALKAACQRLYEETHSRADFMALIHKSYLGD